MPLVPALAKSFVPQGVPPFEMLTAAGVSVASAPRSNAVPVGVTVYPLITFTSGSKSAARTSCPVATCVVGE